MGEVGFGAIPSPRDIRDYRLVRRSGNKISTPQYIVDKVKVKNQGAAPTCVAHALAEIVEYNYWNEVGNYEPFSTEYIYGQHEEGYKVVDRGMYIREGLDIVRKNGDVFFSSLSGNTPTRSKAAQRLAAADFNVLQEKAFPYRISSYYRIDTVDDLKYSIMTNGPAVGGMWWNEGAKLKTGIYSCEKNENSVAHAVIIIGWTKDHFIVQNSWGKTWGIKGTFLVPINKFFNIFYEVYGVTDDIDSVKKPNSFVKAIAPAINSIMSVIKK